MAALLGSALTTGALAQEDGSEVTLPLEAQTCNLPSAPPRIAEEATYDELAVAKSNVNTFQGELASYRECLDIASGSGELTDGNQIALTQAYNYSVEMEERIAEQFNVAVRAYKARQADEG
jgi:hypothetical protein